MNPTPAQLGVVVLYEGEAYVFVGDDPLTAQTKFNTLMGRGCTPLTSYRIVYEETAEQIRVVVGAKATVVSVPKREGA